MEDLLEAVLKIVDTLPVDLLHFQAFICQFRAIFTCDLLHRDGSLVDQSLHSRLQLLKLLLLLLRDAETDQFVEASLHKVIHACHKVDQHLKSAGTLRHPLDTTYERVTLRNCAHIAAMTAI